MDLIRIPEAARKSIPLSQFSRAGVSWTLEPTGATEFGKSSPLSHRVAFAEPFDIEVFDLMPIEGGPDARVVPGHQHIAESVLWGYTATGTTLYYSETGNTWKNVWTAATTIRALWILNDGSALLGLTNRQLWRATWDGSSATLTHVLTLSDEATFELQTTSLRQAPHGTIVLAEYGFGRKIYRSTDGGATWDERLDITNVDHWHAISWHAGKEAWVALRGDQAGSLVAKSYDDGLTWEIWPSGAEGYGWQPVGALDVGHPTKLMTGADDWHQVGMYDLETNEIGTVYADLDQRQASFIFSLGRYDGVTYAVSYYTTTNRGPVVLASRNHRDWVIVYRFPLNVSNPWWCGVKNGKLLLRSSQQGLIRLTPKPIRHINAIHYGPAKTNLLALESSKFVSAKGDWFNRFVAEISVERVASPSMFNEGGALQVYREVGGGLAQTAHDGTPISPGDVVTAGLWVRAGQHNKSSIYLNIVFMNAANTALVPADGVPVLVVPARDKWTLLTCQMKAPPDTVWIRLSVQYGTHANNEIFIGAAYVSIQGPMAWYPGPTVRPADRDITSLMAPEGWTNLLAIRPEVHSDYFRDVSIIRRWELDSNNYADLKWDGVNKKIVLSSVTAGGAPEIVESSVQQWQRLALIWVAVRASSSGLSLSLSNGQAWEHVAGTVDNAGLVESQIISRYGPGTDWMPHDICVNRWWPHMMTDSEVEQAPGLRES